MQYEVVAVIYHVDVVVVVIVAAAGSGANANAAAATTTSSVVRRAVAAGATHGVYVDIAAIVVAVRVRIVAVVNVVVVRIAVVVVERVAPAQIGERRLLLLLVYVELLQYELVLLDEYRLHLAGQHIQLSLQQQQQKLNTN